MKTALHSVICGFCESEGLSVPVAEHPFGGISGKRKWKFDFAWPKAWLALEVEGGTWSKGRHTRGKGYESDCFKYSEAAIMGWIVLRCTTDMIQAGVHWEWIEMMLTG